MHRKLTEGPADTRNVDGWSLICTESWQRLMKGPTDIGKVDGRSHGCTESLWKFLRPHGKLTDVDGRSRWCTESWWIVLRMYRRLTEVDGWTFCQLSVRPQKPPSTSVNFPFFRAIFRKLTLTFYASMGTSVKYQWSSRISLNIHQIYVRQRDIPSTLRSSTGPSVNFHQHCVCPWKTFCAEAGPFA